ncbi:ABC1 kinase family protein [Sphingobacterium hungaricum]|uniref:Ubiquinone biosynthesis protein n=1 Tax=Sphingobacterium hungaricum TaxID=2082723 RepID=A0A928URZ9_9SPHI|nr:AarF/UbiB family protein [Sphingobacterium hungaricum]MBE8712216.1 ubiquinone biosynthesis protein [Sphingobacterium hungaricum]
MFGFDRIKRVGKIVQVLSKYGFDELLSRSNIDRVIPDSVLSWNTYTKTLFEQDFNVRVRLAIEELGPTFIKLGQLLSNRPDIIPDELRLELEKLQDTIPAEKLQVEKLLEEAFKIDVYAHFSYIDPEPIAAASIAQVYRASLIDGTPVILKIKRPGIREVIRADISFIKDLIQFLEKKYEIIQKMNLYAIVSSFESSLMQELSFTNEANNIEKFRKNFQGNPNIYVPKIYRTYCSDGILCMEFIDGVKINDLDSLEKMGLYPKSIVQNGLDLYLEQVLVHGFFHADPHPGNMFVNAKGQIVFLDFGSMGLMIPYDRKLIEGMVINFLMNDAPGLIRNIKKLAVVHHIENERQLTRDVFEIFYLIEQNSLKDINIAVMLDKLNTVLQQNYILMPDFVYLLLRGVSILEGTGRQLDANLNIPNSIRPFAKKIAKERLSAEHLKEEIIEKAKLLKDIVSEVPTDLLSILDKVKNDKLLLKHKIVDFESLLLNLYRLGNKFLLSILAMTFGVGASILAHGRVGYLLWGMPILSWLGFLVSFVISTILLINVLKSK